MRAKVRGTELYFDVEGAGLVPDGAIMREKPVALLVHGGPGADHSGFKPAFSPLSQGMQLVYFDHRGQGRSARGPKDTYTLENNVEDMEALRQYLGLDQIVVLGVSYGGMVALTYASRYPQNVLRLIVIASTPDSRFLARAAANLQTLGTPEQLAISRHLWEGSFRDDDHLQEFFRIMAPLYSRRRNSTNPRNHTILSVDAINVAYGGFLRTYDVRGELRRITAPTLVIAGRHDWICPPELSEDIARLIPNARIHIFEDSGHSVRADEPDALIELISNFVEDRWPDVDGGCL